MDELNVFLLLLAGAGYRRATGAQTQAELWKRGRISVVYTFQTPVIAVPESWKIKEQMYSIFAELQDVSHKNGQQHYPGPRVTS